jgi:hypothetical protein
LSSSVVEQILMKIVQCSQSLEVSTYKDTMQDLAVSNTPSVLADRASIEKNKRSPTQGKTTNES